MGEQRELDLSRAHAPLVGPSVNQSEVRKVCGETAPSGGMADGRHGVPNSTVEDERPRPR